jgi:hypothetical protein
VKSRIHAKEIEPFPGFEVENSCTEKREKERERAGNTARGEDQN